MKVNSQLERAQLENLTSLPAAATAGRVAWDTVAGKTFLDDGTDWRAFLRNDQTAIIGNNGTAASNIRFHRGAAGVLQFVSGADATAEGTLSTAINQISARVENYATGSLPANANAGRIVWDTTTGTLKLDSGAAWKEYVDTNTTQTLTGKTMAAASNTFTGLALLSTLTTKGDIFAATGAGAVTNLPAGTDGFILYSDSSQSSGLRWGLNSAAVAVPTGASMPFAGTNAPTGYILLSGRTIGSGASGATERANSDTQDLYVLLWDSYANTELAIQDSAGAASTRGASAAADFAANKRLPVPDMRGRSAVGKDNMGGSTASRITNAGAGIVGTTLGAAGGTQTHQLTTAQLASHTHIQNSHTHGMLAFKAGASYNGGSTFPSNTAGNAAQFVTDSTTPTNQNAGSDTAHQNTQPSMIFNYIVKL